MITSYSNVFTLSLVRLFASPLPQLAHSRGLSHSRMNVGEAVSVDDWVNFISWFSPKRKNESILGNVYLTLKIP